MPNGTFLALALAKVDNISLKSKFLASSFSTERMASPLSRSSVIVDLRYVLISLSLLKLRSALATVTGIVNNIRSPIQRFVNKSFRSVFFINCKTWIGVDFLWRIDPTWSSSLYSSLASMSETPLSVRWAWSSLQFF